MTTRHLIDPEIEPVIELLGLIEISSETLSLVREGFAGREMPEGPLEPVIHHAKGRDGAPDVPLLVYDPPSDKRNRAAILHIHAGGMVIGSAEMSRMSMPFAALAHDAVAVSVEYRLAPETAFPGPQEDCYAGLAWLVEHASELGVDPDRITVMGESAGGGLAAALAQMVRDRGEYKLAGQVLIYPMLDHRTGGADCQWRNPMTGEFVWTPSSNQFGWESLRGSYAANDARKGWFSPALAESLADLPPAYIAVGALDLFLDEDLDYARRLIAAGVPVEVHVYPGAIHGFDMISEAAVSKQAHGNLSSALSRLLG
jgi:acetyl esterase